MTDMSRILASLNIVLGMMLFVSAPAMAQAVTIAVQATGELPGFRIEEAAPYLAAEMATAGISAWRFVPRDPGLAAPNRIEWTFALLPYAGGEVRRFFPMSEARRMDVHLQGMHRLISAQARLVLNGEYQTVTFGQEAVQGGADDPDLTAFLVRTTRSLEGAWRAIDMTPAKHAGALP
ncbi:MAG TPA: hypothetical protein VNY75_05310 [Rhizomicrobium sp.]|jgi:hypothetical protein|nr:hypothetical protein [Rhizomicrobium sp.]